MDRRKFLKQLPLATGATALTLNSIPIRLMGGNNPLLEMARMSTNDKVLVVLQLHGGNDGLNAVIPIEQYDQYYSRRANIAIPRRNGVRRLIELDSTLPFADQVGLHPDMIGMKTLYDQGRMAILQGVSYPNNNGSHFRGRDIRFMGGGPDDYFSSGWIGRYLQKTYEPLTYPDNFPNADMPDPLALEMGNDSSLIFHQEGNIPTSISLGSNPESLQNLINQLEGFVDENPDPRGRPPAALDDSLYGRELNWILGLEEKSEEYAERLVEVYNRANETGITYPERYPFNAPGGSLRNGLTPQLQLIARLLEGGIKTKVFMIRIGGFDTHAEQVESYDPTMGSHAALLYHISSAMEAFQRDLRERGVEDRVITMTTSEFGRRIDSNGSYGTDHGTGAPLFLFGKGVNPGVLGTNQDLTNGRRNVDMQFDYRQVYSGLLRDWMGVDKNTIVNDIFFGNYIDGPNTDAGGNYEPLTLTSSVVTSVNEFINERYRLNDAYPNPARDFTNIRFRINSPGMVKLELMDGQGRRVKILLDESKNMGEHDVKADLRGLEPGVYFYRIQSGLLEDTKKLLIR